MRLLCLSGDSIWGNTDCQEKFLTKSLGLVPGRAKHGEASKARDLSLTTRWGTPGRDGKISGALLGVGDEPLAFPPTWSSRKPGEQAPRGSRVQPALMRAGCSKSGNLPVRSLPGKTVAPLLLARRRGEAVERGFAGPAGPQVDEPVHAAHHQSAANDVADGCRQQIVPQEIPPGQNGPAVL